MASYEWPPQGSGSSSGVTSLNSLTGALTIIAGTGITVTPSGSNITIAATGSGAGTVTNVSVVSANGLAGTVATATTTPAITLSTTVTGILQGNGTAISAATTGNLTDAGTDGIVVTGGTGAVLGSGTSLAQHVADTTHNGYLSSTDWNTFNSKLTATLANTNIFVGNGSNVATAVAMSDDATLANTGALTLATVNSNVGSFTYSSITVNAKGLITAASNGTAPVTTLAAVGASPNANAATISGNTLNLQPFSSAQPGVVIASGGGTTNFLRADGTWAAPTGGSGTVTSVAMTVPTFLSVSGSPVTTSGTLAVTLSGTALPILNGGTGQTTAAAARASSGLNIDERTAVADTNYTVLNTDRTVALTSISVSRTFTLPAANTLNAGQSLLILDASGSLTNSITLTVQRAGSDTINGGTNVILSSAYAELLLTSNGSNGWNYNPAISTTGTIISDWVSYSPTTGGLGTLTSSSLWWRRVGDSMQIQGNVQAGTVAAATASYNLPSGFNIDTAKISSSTNAQVVGLFESTNPSDTRGMGSSTAGYVFFDGSTTATLFFASNNGGTTQQWTKANGSTLFNTGNQFISISTVVPISGWTSTGAGIQSLSIGTFDGQSPVATGASVNAQGNTLFMQSASGSQPGLVNTTTQTFAGAKSISTGGSTTAFNIDSPSFVFDSTNNALGIGNAPSSATFIDGLNTSGATKRLLLTGYGTASLVGMRTRLARGTSGSPTAVQTGDIIGFYNAEGYGTSQFPATATGAISIIAGENFSNTSNLTYVTINSTPTGAVTSTENLRVASTGCTIGPQSSSTAIHSINGGESHTTRTITGNLTIDTTTADYIIFCNQSGAITITLPTPTAGRILIIKDISGTAETNNITMARHASESIEGIAASKILATNWGSWTFTSDGTNWFMV